MIPLIKELRACRGRGEWNLSSTFVLSVAWLYNGTLALAAFAGAKGTFQDAAGNTVTVYAPWVSSVNQYASRSIILLALIALGLQVAAGRATKVSTVALASLGAVGSAAVSTWLNGGSVLKTATVALIACLGAALVLPRGKGGALGAATFGVSLGVLSGVLSLVRPEAATLLCRPGKCGVLGSLMVGTLGNENALGLALAAAIPFAWLAFRPPLRVWLVLYLAGMVAASGSRTALVAALFSLGFLFLIRPALADRSPRSSHVLLANIIGIGGLAAGFVIPSRATDPSQYTGRAHLWDLAENLIQQRPVLGWGGDAWGRLYEIGLIVRGATYSVHNQWLDVLFIGGLVGGITFALLVLSLFLPLSGSRAVLAWTLLTPMIYAGIAERLWGVSGMDWLSYSLLASVLVVPSAATVKDHFVTQAVGEPHHSAQV